MKPSFGVKIGSGGLFSLVITSNDDNEAKRVERGCVNSGEAL